ncbi:MAG: ATP-binding protein [Bryobacteraceae bacterium]
MAVEIGSLVKYNVIMEESSDRPRTWQADERLERLIATALHDVRNPLNTASLQAQLLVKQHGKDLAGEPLRIAAEIPRQLTKAKKVLDGIDKFIGILFGAWRSDLVPLEEALDSALKSLESDFRNWPGCLERSPLPVVRGDGTQLAEVFKQLLSNALRFGGGEHPVISITCMSSESGCRISIRDAGFGFEEKYAEEIFEPFKRLHDLHMSGAGLGLALCREILTRHGGRIWAESKLNWGSVFHLEFPPPSEPPDPPVHETF